MHDSCDRSFAMFGTRNGMVVAVKLPGVFFFLNVDFFSTFEWSAYKL